MVLSLLSAKNPELQTPDSRGDGLEVVKSVYDRIGKFKKGRAKVMKDGKYGIIDSDGLEIVPL